MTPTRKELVKLCKELAEALLQCVCSAKHCPYCRERRRLRAKARRLK